MSSWRGVSGARDPGAGILTRASALERAGDLSGAISAYEIALKSTPDNADIVARLATLATRIEMFEAAARLWAEVSRLQPGRVDAIDGRARAWCALGQFDDAIFLLRETLLAHPDEARLWNSLGVILLQSGQAGAALTFFDRALDLDPRFAAAAYHRGNAHFDLGDLEATACDYRLARTLAKTSSEIAAIRFAQATAALASGDLAQGWEAYEARLSPHAAKAVTYDVPGRRWTPSEPLEGKKLLLVAEQGLGDEMMFAGLLPDVLEALGPAGRLSLAVEPRLAPLFTRSFPQAAVGAHVTVREGPRLRRRADGLGGRQVDLWAPMASLPQRFRRTLADFPTAGGYLRPDPARIAHWRAWLGDGPPTVGVSWRSGKVLGDRRRQYPPQNDWIPLLQTPGVRIVNLQYGECAEELAAFDQATGCAILEPPGIDLREDIDDLAALCTALDLVVTVSNATGALAGACGARVALIAGPAAWPRLGTDRMPWYPQARVLLARAFDDWSPAMTEAVDLVSGLVQA